jgi:hypothetical protein
MRYDFNATDGSVSELFLLWSKTFGVKCETDCEPTRSLINTRVLDGEANSNLYGFERTLVDAVLVGNC